MFLRGASVLSIAMHRGDLSVVVGPTDVDILDLYRFLGLLRSIAVTMGLIHYFL